MKLDYWIIGLLDDWTGGKRPRGVGPSIQQSTNPSIQDKRYEQDN
jgi:hypothetical protein